MVVERPKQPEPTTLRVQYNIDAKERWMCQMHGDSARYVKRIRALLSNLLAEEIEKKLQLVSDEMIMTGDERITLEVTLHDRGTYENWLPVERRQGKEDGVKQERKRIEQVTPYGFEPQQFYE